MAIWHGEKGKKRTGGKINLQRKKRKYELGNLPTFTGIGKIVLRKIEMKGGGQKTRALSAEFANVFDPSLKTSKKVKILDVIDNPANPNFPRRKIITRGAIVQTEMGKVRITSRPSQHGIVNAIKLQEK